MTGWRLTTRIIARQYFIEGLKETTKILLRIICIRSNLEPYVSQAQARGSITEGIFVGRAIYFSGWLP